tara:strand:+ start:154 stop:1044 length:891 start_codon:yes stop_codon:yes gene_type:complete
MKRFTVILLLFGILGCTSKSVYREGVLPSEMSESNNWVELKEAYRSPSVLISASSAPTWDVEKQKLGDTSKIFYRIDSDNKKIEFMTSGNLIYGNVGRSPCGAFTWAGSEIPKLCINSFGGGIKKFPELGKTKFLTCNFGIQPDYQMYFFKDKSFSIECKTSEDIRIENENALANLLEEKKSKCRSYGFKDNTDGMGLCLIELDKLDAITNQSNMTAQQQAEAKKQREAQALINLGAIIGGAGVPNNPQPKTKPSIPSYSESYTMSRTVPSTQICPLLGIPLKKQEVKNGNRICYY